MTDPLDERERAILDFEARWAGHDGAKEDAIRRELDMAPARYYQLLVRVMDTAAAQSYAPLLVGRLRRRRDEERLGRRERERALRG